jgi:hypothetical protein
VDSSLPLILWVVPSGRNCHVSWQAVVGTTTFHVPIIGCPDACGRAKQITAKHDIATPKGSERSDAIKMLLYEFVRRRAALPTNAAELFRSSTPSWHFFIGRAVRPLRSAFPALLTSGHYFLLWRSPHAAHPALARHRRGRRARGVTLTRLTFVSKDIESLAVSVPQRALPFNPRLIEPIVRRRGTTPQSRPWLPPVRRSEFRDSSV